MPYPWEHSPWRRDLEMLLTSWVLLNVRYSPLMWGPTSIVTVRRSDCLSSHQVFLCFLGSSQSICDLRDLVWLCSGANTRANVSCVFTDWSIGYKNMRGLSESPAQRALKNCWMCMHGTCLQWHPWAEGEFHHGSISPSSLNTKLEWICPSVHDKLFVKPCYLLLNEWR